MLARYEQFLSAQGESWPIDSLFYFGFSLWNFRWEKQVNGSAPDMVSEENSERVGTSNKNKVLAP